jgi:hypothetical protein
MKCTRQRCHEAFSTRATAAFRPSCASEITQLDATQAAPGQAAQEVGPECLGLAGTDRHAEHFAAAVAVCAHRDNDCNGDDAAILAHLHIRCVEPDIRPVTLDRSMQEGLHAVVDVGAQP